MIRIIITLNILKSQKKHNLIFHSLTKERWKDFEELFGPRGAVGGCWCMWWRISRAEYRKQIGDGNKRAIKKIVNKNEVPGILAYVDGKAVGWCSIQPRDVFPRLDNSRVLKRVDDKPVWSIVCFFIARGFRKTGISEELIKEAVKHAKKRGAKIIEGYPTEPKKEKSVDAFVYTGFYSSFKKAGFKEVERRSETRPIMRYYIK